jgi:hypothetical protein
MQSPEMIGATMRKARFSPLRRDVVAGASSSTICPGRAVVPSIKMRPEACSAVVTTIPVFFRRLPLSRVVSLPIAKPLTVLAANIAIVSIGANALSNRRVISLPAY